MSGESGATVPLDEELIRRDDVRILLPHLRLLAALGEAGQVTVAAQIVGMSQPAASRTLRRLEERLGVRLMAADGRGVTLTPAATALMPHLRRALDALGDGVEALRAADDEARHTIRVAFQNSFGERLIPALIKRVRRTHPEVRFQLTQGSRRHCLDLLESGGTDLGLIALLRVRSDFTVVHLFDQPLTVAVPEGHPLAERSGRIAMRELAPWPLVTLKHGYGLRESVEDLCRAAGFEPRFAFEGEDLYSLIGLVAAGLGVGIVPEGREGYRGCVQLSIEDPAAMRDVGAVYARGSQAPGLGIVLDGLRHVVTVDEQR